MPDELIIAKLTLEDSGYLRAVDNMTAGTQKYIDAQHKANDELKKAQDLLKNNQAHIEFLKTTKASAVELEKAEAANEALIKSVADAQAVYDKATKAAQDFFAASQKVQSIQNIPAPGNILQPPIPLPVAAAGGAPPGGPPPGGGGPPDDPSFITILAEKINAALENLPNIEDIFSGSENVKEVTDAVALLNDELKLAGVYLNSLDKNSDEFKTLKPAFENAKKVAEVYNNTIQQTGEKHVSLRTKILNLKNELFALEEADKSNTKEFTQKQKEVARLTRLYTEQQERIRILSSQTRALDFGKAGIQAAIGAFQTFTSISVIAGENQEKLEKQTQKLFAAMSLLNGIEEIHNAVKKDGIIVTNLNSVAQATYTAVVGASTGALKAFRVALLSTGVLALVAGIVFLITKLKELKDAQEESNRESKIAAEVNEKAIEGYAGEVSQLEVLKRALTDLNTPQEDRIRLAEEYNKTADQTNRIDIEQINNTDLLTAAINRQIDVIKQRALAKASQAVTEEKASDLFKARQKLAEAAPDFVVDEANIDKQIADATTRALDAAKKNVVEDGKFLSDKLLTIVEALREIKDANKDFVASANLAAKLQPLALPELPKSGSVEERVQELHRQIDTLTNVINNETSRFDEKLLAQRRAQLKKLQTELETLEGKEGATKIIENVFQSEVDKLNTELATLNASQERSLETINKQFSESLVKEKNRINDLLKEKKVTKTEAKILVDLSVKINEAQKQRAIEDLNKEIAETKEKIQESINTLQLKAQVDTASLIQEEFTRRAAIISINEQKELQQNQRNLDEQLQQLRIDRNKKLITEEQYQSAKNQFVEAGEQIANDIIIRNSRERQQLSVDIFKQTLAQYEAVIRDTQTQIDVKTADSLTNLSSRVLQGTLSIRQFTEQVDEIKRQSAAKSRTVDIQQRQAELFALEHHLSSMRDTTSVGYRELVEKRKQLTEELAKLTAADAEADVSDKKDKTDKATAKTLGYVNAIGSLTQSIIGFWQAANAAEEKALDRSIQLQQRRVDEAIRIADKGNASYLKAEQDRLKQLEVQRENAARRQLGIEAAIQAANLLTGITGAIAKIGTGIGAVEAIAEIATIVGLLATGYGLIKQLQANQPKFKEGTTYVERGANKPGTDTVPAWLNEGEAVIPADKNQKYKRAVEAIYHEKIPAEDMNDFVYSYAKSPVKGFTHAQVENMFTKKTDVRKLDENGRLVYSLVNVAKKLMGQQHDTKFLSTLKAEEVAMYSQVINNATNRHFAQNKSETTETFNIKKVVHTVANDLKKYQGFATSMKHVSEKDMESFITNYNTNKQLKTMTEVVNSSIKHAPIPNYQNIGTITESKITSDSKMQYVMGEQNALIKQNNEHQKETHRLLKGMGVSLKIDRDGVSAMVMKAIEEKKIYSKT